MSGSWLFYFSSFRCQPALPLRALPFSPAGVAPQAMSAECWPWCVSQRCDSHRSAISLHLSGAGRVELSGCIAQIRRLLPNHQEKCLGAVDVWISCFSPSMDGYSGRSATSKAEPPVQSRSLLQLHMQTVIFQTQLAVPRYTQTPLHPYILEQSPFSPIYPGTATSWYLLSVSRSSKDLVFPMLLTRDDTLRSKTNVIPRPATNQGVLWIPKPFAKERGGGGCNASSSTEPSVNLTTSTHTETTQQITSKQ